MPTGLWDSRILLLNSSRTAGSVVRGRGQVQPTAPTLGEGWRSSPNSRAEMGEEAERTIPECLPGPAFCHSPMGWRLGTGATGLGIGIGCDCRKKDGGRLAEVGTPEPESHGASCSFMPLDAWVRVPSRAGKQTRETDTRINGCTCTHLPLRDWELWKPGFLRACWSLPRSPLQS